MESSQRDAREVVDEVTPLLKSKPGDVRYGAEEGATAEASPVEQINDAPTSSSRETGEVEVSKKRLYAKLSVLLVGVFISQADGTLVFATYGRISSELQDMRLGSFIISAYVMAQCVAQPLYGKLSDIYGRKTCLQTAYVLFTIGCTGCAMSSTMAQVIVSRAVQGMGGAGMVCMVSILIADLVPIGEVALVRSYSNVVQTIGRSSGGTIGGYLAQTLGWRWAFLAQTPLGLLSMLLVWLVFDLPERAQNVDQTSWTKLKRVDFVGAALLSLTIFGVCLVLDIGGTKVAWNSPVVVGTASGTAVSCILFLASSKYMAKEPIFPLRLLTQPVLANAYGIILLQNAVQMTLMMTLPVYFQVTQNAGPAISGAYLIPSIVGNTIGGILTGYWIKRTGLYKLPTILAPTSSLLAFTLCYLFWKGHTTLWEAVITVFPAGLATGVAHSAVFIALASGVSTEDMATVGSGFYLCGNLGIVAGAAAATAVYQQTLVSGLQQALAGYRNAEDVIKETLTDVDYIHRVGSKLRAIMMPAYINSFHYVLTFSIICSAGSLILALFSSERRLRK